MPLKGEPPESTDVPDRDHLQDGVRPEADHQLALVDPGLEPGGKPVLHEEHWPQNHVRWEAEATDHFLHALLVVKVGDPRRAMRRADRGVDVVLNALPLGEVRDALALLLLALDPGLPRVLHSEDTPHT